VVGAISNEGFYNLNASNGNNRAYSTNWTRCNSCIAQHNKHRRSKIIDLANSDL